MAGDACSPSGPATLQPDNGGPLGRTFEEIRAAHRKPTGANGMSIGAGRPVRDRKALAQTSCNGSDCRVLVTFLDAPAKPGSRSNSDVAKKGRLESVEDSAKRQAGFQRDNDLGRARRPLVEVWPPASLLERE